MRKKQKRRIRISSWFRLFGYATFLFDAREHAVILNIILQKHLPVVSQAEEVLVVPRRNVGDWESALREKGVAFTLRRGGLPAKLARYKLRVGVVIGALLFAAILFFGTAVVWEVHVEGTESILAADIKSDLSEMGVSVGSFIPFMDFEEICNRYRLENPEIAWMGIYRTGTVLQVKILEADSFKEEETPQYANIVAKEDGVIEALLVTRGTAVVKKGQSVKKGDLLVSGLLKGETDETFICAEAVVMGRREEEFSVFVPYEQTRSVQKETLLERYMINFFGKTINISINSGKIPESYGTIIKENSVCFSDGRRLPVSLTRVLRVNTVEERCVLSHEEALRLAYALLKNKLSSLLEEGSLLSKSVTATATEQGVYLHGRVSYTCNIAQVLPFSVD